jgi:hypothetical protein
MLKKEKAGRRIETLCPNSIIFFDNFSTYISVPPI